MVIYWAESAQTQYQDIFKNFFNSSIDNQKELEKVFGNLKNGLEVDIDYVKIDLNQRFYILCLAPNAARLSIRFFTRIHLVIYWRIYQGIMKECQ